jgi:hypothetical protein
VVYDGAKDHCARGRADVAAAAGVSADRVLINSISGGSAVVDFSVTPTVDGTPLAANALSAAFAADVSLPTLGVSTVGAVSAPTVSEISALQAQMISLQTKVDGLLDANTDSHFLCDEGWNGPACNLDQTPPTLVCPISPMSIAHDPGSSVATVEFPAATATDISFPVPVAVTPTPSGGTFALGSVTTIAYEIADASGNTASCNVDIEITDVDECAGEGGGHGCLTVRGFACFESRRLPKVDTLCICARFRMGLPCATIWKAATRVPARQTMKVTGSLLAHRPCFIRV